MLLSRDFEDCVDAWTLALGSENVQLCTEESTAGLKATFKTDVCCRYVLRPASATEVQACVRVANRYKAQIYVFSAGKNWGLGSGVPAANVHAVLDLGRMRSIIEFDEKLGYMVVEPGVTFEQASRFLREKKSRRYLSVTGGPPKGSLVGNATERGEGVGPYGDRLLHTTDYEVVLPSGDIVNTGMSRFSSVSTRHLHSHSTGPALNGLFTQSNLGIVTRMTYWLAEYPNYTNALCCHIRSSEKLPALINRARSLMAQNVFQPNSFIMWNSYKLMARLGQYPWNSMEGRTPLNLAAVKGSEPWYVNASICAATVSIGHATCEYVETELTDLVDEIGFVDVADSEDSGVSAGFFGVPTNANAKSTYWRMRSTPEGEPDPDRDDCGVVWLCPVLPLDGEIASNALSVIDAVIKEHGYEPNLSVNFRDSRCLQVFVAIMYDRTIVGEDDRAMGCHDRLMERLIEMGHFPCRLGIHSMDALPDPIDDSRAIQQSIKKALDPNNVLSPGRYD